jgi:hypothetical protein
MGQRALGGGGVGAQVDELVRGWAVQAPLAMEADIAVWCLE